MFLVSCADMCGVPDSDASRMVIYAEVNVCSETGRPCAINQDE
jgi:hypothetical protein